MHITSGISIKFIIELVTLLSFLAGHFLSIVTLSRLIELLEWKSEMYS